MMAEFLAFASDDLQIVPDDELQAYEASVVVDTVDGNSEPSIMYFGESELSEQDTVIRTRLKAYLARRMWGIAAWYPVIQDVDVMVIEAMSLWSSASNMTYFVDPE